MVVLRTYSTIAMFYLLEYNNIIYLYIIVIQDGDTALIRASYNGRLPVVEYLVQQGADINTQDKVRNNYINY